MRKAVPKVRTDLSVHAVFMSLSVFCHNDIVPRTVITKIIAARSSVLLYCCFDIIGLAASFYCSSATKVTYHEHGKRTIAMCRIV